MFKQISRSRHGSSPLAFEPLSRLTWAMLSHHDLGSYVNYAPLPGNACFGSRPWPSDSVHLVIFGDGAVVAALLAGKGNAEPQIGCASETLT